MASLIAAPAKANIENPAAERVSGFRRCIPTVLQFATDVILNGRGVLIECPSWILWLFDASLAQSSAMAPYRTAAQDSRRFAFRRKRVAHDARVPAIKIEVGGRFPSPF